MTSELVLHLPSVSTSSCSRVVDACHALLLGHCTCLDNIHFFIPIDLKFLVCSGSAWSFGNLDACYSQKSGDAFDSRYLIRVIQDEDMFVWGVGKKSQW